MPTTPINGLPTPDNNSPNLPPIHFDALAGQLDTRLVPRFANTAARDAAIPAPVEGQVCHVAEQVSPALPARLMVYSGGTWRLIGPPSLPALVGPWTDPAGDFGFAGDGYMEITRMTLPDPGFPYRVSVRARCEIGAVTTSGTRVDMQVWLQQGGAWTFVDTDQGYEPQAAGRTDGVSFQTITTGIVNSVFTGTVDVVVRAFRVYGGSLGRISGNYKHLTAARWAA